MNAPHLLDKHIGLCIAHARGWLDPVLRAAHARLLTPNHPSVQGAPRPVVAAAVEFLQLRGAALSDAFERELGRQLRDDVAPARHAETDEPGLAEWTLVDEDAAAEEVEVVRTIQLVEGGAEWELRELQARTATLRGQSAVGARSNPLRPEVVARSLWAAAQALGLPGPERRVLLRAASDPLTPAMQQACRDAVGWLTQWGVEPAAWKVTSVASGRLPAPPSSGFDVTRPGALDELRAVASGTGSLSRGGTGLHGASHGAAGGTPAARAASDQATQALLAALFERMLGDACLAAPVLARVGRLQPVVLRVALAQPQLFDDHAHPLWRLLNRMATQALGYADEGDPRLVAYLAQLDPWVADLVALRQPDPAQLAEAVAALESLCLAHLRAEQKSLGGAIERLRRAEREAEAGASVRAQMASVLSSPAAQERLSPLLRDLFAGPWCDAIGRVAVRDGAGSPLAQRLSALPQQLLDSLQPMPTPALRAQALRQLPALAAALQEGLQLTALPAAQRDAVADELLARHTEMLKGGRAAASASTSAEDIVRRLREEDDATGPGGLDPRLAPPTVIDEGQLDTLPAEMVDTAAPVRSLRWLDGAQPGLWCHLFAQGGWRAARLIWVSETRAHWLLSSAAGATHSLTARAVERLARDGLLAPLEERNLLERAIDGWLADTRKPHR